MIRQFHVGTGYSIIADDIIAQLHGKGSVLVRLSIVRPLATIGRNRQRFGNRRDREWLGNITLRTA